jgi:hypothetical protein
MVAICGLLLGIILEFSRRNSPGGGMMLAFGASVAISLSALILCNIVSLMFAICATLRHEPNKPIRRTAYVMALLTIPLQIVLAFWVATTLF